MRERRSELVWLDKGPQVVIGCLTNNFFVKLAIFVVACSP